MPDRLAAHDTLCLHRDLCRVLTTPYPDRDYVSTGTVANAIIEMLQANPVVVLRALGAIDLSQQPTEYVGHGWHWEANL